MEIIKKMTPSKFVERKISKHTAGIEKEIGRQYILLYAETKTKVAELYAKLGSNPTLEEAQKYNRLQNLATEIRQKYKELTGKTITKAEALSKYNYEQAYYGTLWGGELESGKFRWKNASVESIRASVMWEGTGLSMPKRFGINMIKELGQIESAITRGLANGFGYKKTAEMLKDAFVHGINDAIRVVRTESTRNRNEGYNAAFDQMKAAKLPVKKIWISIQDERTRGQKPSDKYDHLILDGLESDDDGMFDVGQGIGKVSGPGLSGIAAFDINCRCSQATKFTDEEDFTTADLDEFYAEWSRNNIP